jgi:hypothetical protein
MVPTGILVQNTCRHLTLHEAEDVILFDTNPFPANVMVKIWESLQRWALVYLSLYTKPDIYSMVESSTGYPTFKHKWDGLKAMFSGMDGSTSIFNMWINLTHAKFDDSLPLSPQLAKLNEIRVNLTNANMGVSETQYSLILLNTLPSETVATILLASGPPTSLKLSKISAWVINEEGRSEVWPWCIPWAESRAPIKSSDKGKGKKKDHSNLMCHYCNEKGHIQPDCCKKKKDGADKKKKEEGGSRSGQKAANSHVLVPTMDSIKEVDDNNVVGVALYTAEPVRWMMDCGATHHITPHRSDFETYMPCKGSVCLGDKSTIDQVGVGSIVFKTSLEIHITLSNVLHLPQVIYIESMVCAQSKFESQVCNE